MNRRIIDIHTHLAYHKLYSDKFIQGIAKRLTTDGDEADIFKIKKFITMWLNDKTGEKLINQMNESGIEKSVLLIIDFFYDYEDAPVTIEEIYYFFYELSKTTDRFIIFAGIDPRRGDEGFQLFKKGINEYNFKGLKLYPPCGFRCDDPTMEPYYELCNQYDLPILIHTGPSLETYATYSDFYEEIANIARRYRQLNLILGHAAIKSNQLGVRLALEYENVFLDISSFQSEVQDVEKLKEKLRYAFEQIPNQLLFGTDWPMFNLRIKQERWVHMLEELLELTDEELDKLFYENCSRVLKIKI